MVPVSALDETGGRLGVTLRTRLTAAFLAVVLVPVLVGAVLALGQFPRTVRELQGRGLAAGAGFANAAVAERCLRVLAAAEAAAQAADRDDEALDAALERLVEARALDGVRVTDASGERARRGRVAADGTRDCRRQELGRSGSRSQLVVTLPLRRPAATGAGGEPVPDGEVVASATVDDGYARALRKAAGVDAVVLVADGRAVAASGPVDDDLVRAGLESGGVVEVDGQVAVAPRLDGALRVLVVQRTWTVASPWLLVPALVAVAGLAATAIGAGLARAVTRPLAELGRAASRVAEGDLAPSLAARSTDEVGQLTEAFRVMTARLAVQVDALERSREQLRDGVSRIGSALAGTHDLDRLLGVVLDTAMDATRARAGAVLLCDPVSGELVLSVGRNLAERSVPERLRVAPAQGISGAVSRTGEAVRGRSGDGPGNLRPVAGEPTGVPVVAVPLSSSERTVGVLLLWDRLDAEQGGAPEDFSEQDLTTLRAFASQATVAVDNVQLHDELRRQSATDGLTGLANFRAFTATVGREVERATRFRRPMALLLLDLDRFKQVNDVWGHLRGDAVLVELATRVRDQVRDVDTVARYGGEEFVVVLPETDRAGAEHAAERICAAVRRRPFGAGSELPLEVTVSVGVAVFPDHGSSATDLLGRADEAMYAAKRAGRDGWRLAAVEPATADGSSVGSRT